MNDSIEGALFFCSIVLLCRTTALIRRSGKCVEFNFGVQVISLPCVEVMSLHGMTHDSIENWQHTVGTTNSNTIAKNSRTEDFYRVAKYELCLWIFSLLSSYQSNDFHYFYSLSSMTNLFLFLNVTPTPTCAIVAISLNHSGLSVGQVCACDGTKSSAMQMSLFRFNTNPFHVQHSNFKSFFSCVRLVPLRSFAL